MLYVISISWPEYEQQHQISFIISSSATRIGSLPKVYSSRSLWNKRTQSLPLVTDSDSVNSDLEPGI